MSIGKQSGSTTQLSKWLLPITSPGWYAAVNRNNRSLISTLFLLAFCASLFILTAHRLHRQAHHHHNDDVEQLYRLHYSKTASRRTRTSFLVAGRSSLASSRNRDAVSPSLVVGNTNTDSSPQQGRSSSLSLSTPLLHRGNLSNPLCSLLLTGKKNTSIQHTPVTNFNDHNTPAANTLFIRIDLGTLLTSTAPHQVDTTTRQRQSDDHHDHHPSPHRSPSGGWNSSHDDIAVQITRSFVRWHTALMMTTTSDPYCDPQQLLATHDLRGIKVCVIGFSRMANLVVAMLKSENSTLYPGTCRYEKEIPQPSLIGSSGGGISLNFSRSDFLEYSLDDAGSSRSKFVSSECHKAISKLPMPTSSVLPASAPLPPSAILLLLGNKPLDIGTPSLDTVMRATHTAKIFCDRFLQGLVEEEQRKIERHHGDDQRPTTKQIHQMSGPPLIVASGGYYVQGSGLPEALQMTAIMRYHGLPSSVILCESASTTTMTNAKFSAKLINKFKQQQQQQQQQRGLHTTTTDLHIPVLVVTKKTHEKRAVATVRQKLKQARAAKPTLEVAPMLMMADVEQHRKWVESVAPNKTSVINFLKMRYERLRTGRQATD